MLEQLVMSQFVLIQMSSGEDYYADQIKKIATKKKQGTQTRSRGVRLRSELSSGTLDTTFGGPELRVKM